MKATELSHLLAKQSRKVCEHLLPTGHEHHGNWVSGDLQGNQGDSLQIRLDGEKAGVWLDFATGEKGDMIGLWRQVRNLSLADACKEVESFLGIVPEPSIQAPHSEAWSQVQREMGTGTGHDVNALAALRRLPCTDGLHLAIEHGCLFFGPVHDGERTHSCWIITDQHRHGAQARRMDGQPFVSGAKAKTIQGTTSRWPIGVSPLPEFALVEGGPDFLAAYTAVAMLGAGDRIQPVSMLGSSNSIHPDALAFFGGKTVWMFPHNDENMAGLQGACRWERQLARVRATVIPFDFSAYPGVKDLNDFVSALGAPEPLCLD